MKSTIWQKFLFNTLISTHKSKLPTLVLPLNSFLYIKLGHMRPIVNLLFFNCHLFCYIKLGGIKELVAFLWLSGNILCKHWTKRVGSPFFTSYSKLSSLTARIRKQANTSFYEIDSKSIFSSQNLDPKEWTQKVLKKTRK